MKNRMLAVFILVAMAEVLSATGARAVVYLQENFDSYPAFPTGLPTENLGYYWQAQPGYNGNLWIGKVSPLGDGGADRHAWGVGSTTMSRHRKMFTPGATAGRYVLDFTAWSNSGNPYGSGVGLGYDSGSGAWENRGIWYYYANKTAVDYVTGVSQTGTFWELDMRGLLNGADYMIYVPEADNTPVNLRLEVDQINNQARGEIRTATRTIVLPWNPTISDLVNYVQIWAPGGGYGSIDIDDVTVSDGVVLLASAQPHTATWSRTPVSIPTNEEFAVSVDFTYYGNTEYPALFTIYNANGSTDLSGNSLPALSQGTNCVRLTIPARPLSGTGAVKLELKGNSGENVVFDRILMARRSSICQPQSPENGTVTTSRRPTFQWWGAGGVGGNYTLLIGSDPGITANVSRYTVNGATSFTLPADLPLSSWWFWTVIPAGSDISEADLLKLTEIRSITVVSGRGTAEDTTPPHLYRMAPALESEAAASPLISVQWLETGGSGINPTSAILLLDGATPAGALQVSSTGASLQVASPLSAGRHQASFEISDNKGNKSKTTWQFWVGQRAPSVVTLDANGWILFNGLPFLPISHYTYTYRDVNMTRDVDYPDSGFNMVVNCFNFNTALSYGLKGSQSVNGASYGGWSYFEGFDAVPSGSSITTLGWFDRTSGKDMKVEAGYHVGSGWTGNCARGDTSSLGGEYYELLPAGMPTTGPLQFSAKAWSPNPYQGVDYYYGSGSVGLGDATGKMQASWWGGSSNPNIWQFDCRPMGGGVYTTTMQGFRDIYENDRTVYLGIVVDQTARKVWGVIDNGKGVREETPHYAYTNAPIASVYLFESNFDWKDYGIDVDTISVSEWTQQEIAGDIVASLANFGCDTNHPAWLGCWIDEEWIDSEILPVLQAYRTIANGHLMMPVAYGPWMFAYYPPDLLDIFTFDSYPFPVGPITDHGDGLDAIGVLANAPGKPRHLWSQGFDWTIFGEIADMSNFDYQRDVVNNPVLAGHYFRPSPREMFASAALGWVHGARNAGWWGPGTELIPAQREILKDCARRASWLAPVLRSSPPTQSSTLQSAQVLHRVMLAPGKPAIQRMERQYDGKRYIIVVNVNSEPVLVSFAVPGLVGGSWVKVLWEDRKIQSIGNIFRDVIPGVGAVVYQL